MSQMNQIGTELHKHQVWLESSYPFQKKIDPPWLGLFCQFFVFAKHKMEHLLKKTMVHQHDMLPAVE
jgi:hypothetical protein